MPCPTRRIAAGLTARLQEQLGDLRDLLTQHGPARAAYAAALNATPAADRSLARALHRKIGKTLENERAGYDPGRRGVRDRQRRCWARRARDAADAAWWEEWCQVQIEHLILLYWWRRLDEMAERIARVQPLIERHGTPAQRAALFGNLNRQLNRSQPLRAVGCRARLRPRCAGSAFPPSASPELRAPYQFALGFQPPLAWRPG